MVTDDSAALAFYFARGPQKALYDGHVWVRGIKLYADGALGSRGAALLAPYSDDSGNTGLLVSTPEHLKERSIEALKHGFQVSTHAIGDRGNRNALDAYQAALEAVPTIDARLRIEHAQIISPQDIPRFAQLGVIPSMQASHQTSDMPWAERRLGPERIRGAYAWRALLNTGVVIPNGTDFPVEHVNPIITFHSSVTRQDAENQPPGGWYGDQKMTREEALRSMTLWPAYAAFQESELGSISVGKYADFTILNRDIMRAAPERILGTQVVATYVGGAPVYEAKIDRRGRRGQRMARRTATCTRGIETSSEPRCAMPLQREEEWTRGLVARDREDIRPTSRTGLRLHRGWFRDEPRRRDRERHRGGHDDVGGKRRDEGARLREHADHHGRAAREGEEQERGIRSSLRVHRYVAESRRHVATHRRAGLRHSKVNGASMTAFRRRQYSRSRRRSPPPAARTTPPLQTITRVTTPRPAPSAPSGSRRLQCSRRRISPPAERMRSRDSRSRRDTASG